MTTRNSRGQFKEGHGGIKRNPDRKISIVEQVVTETIKVTTSPDGTKHDKPKSFILYLWILEAHRVFMFNGHFYKGNGQIVNANKPSDRYHIDFIVSAAKQLKTLSITDMEYLAKYKRDGLIENPQLSIVKKHLKNCKNLCSIMDVYAPQFALRGWQREAVNRKEWIVLLTGGRGRGASYTLIPMVVLPLMMASPNNARTNTMNRKSKGFNRTSTFPSVLAFLTVPEFALMVKNINRSTMTIEFVNGSKLVFGGFNDERQREASKGIGASDTLGGEVALSAMEEANAFTIEDFETIKTNTRDKNANNQIPMATNPGPPNHWINTEIILAPLIETTPAGGRVVEYGGKKAIVYSKTAKDNEALMESNPAYWDNLSSIKSPVRRRMLRDGEWLAPEGAVYTEFAEDIHVINDPKFNVMQQLKNGHIVIGLDAGARDATAIAWLYYEAIETIGVNGVIIKTWRVICYRQFYMYNCNRSHIADFVASFPDSHKAKMCVIGHDSVSEASTLRKKGVNTVHNQDKAFVGDYTKSYIAEEINSAFGECVDVGGGAMLPRFVILKNSLIDINTVDQKLKLDDYESPKEGMPTSIQTELPGITWEQKVKDGEKVLTGKLADGNDHMSDAIINGIMYIQHIINRNNAAKLIKQILKPKRRS